MAKPTISLQACADALSHRRSRARSSSATKTKRPATSDSDCEHRNSRAGGARVRATFLRGRQAAEGARHRAQRGRIVRDAPAHLARRRARLGLAVTDVEQHAHLESTTVEFMHNADKFTVSEVSAGLPTCTDAQGCARHTLSVELAAAPLWWPPGKKWPEILTAGSQHRSHGTLPRFRQPGRA